jgi:hypothetical protein
MRQPPKLVPQLLLGMLPRELPLEPVEKPKVETRRSTLSASQLGQWISCCPELLRTSFSNFSPQAEHLYS